MDTYLVVTTSRTFERVVLFEMSPFVAAMTVSFIWGTGEEVQNSPASMKLMDRELSVKERLLQLAYSVTHLL